MVVDTRRKECVNFIDIVYRTNAEVECPFSEIEISFIHRYSSDNSLEYELPFLIKHLNLELKVPNCMIGSDAIIVNTDLPECRGHIRAAYDLQLQPVYPASSIEIHNTMNHRDAGMVK